MPTTFQMPVSPAVHVGAPVCTGTIQQHSAATVTKAASSRLTSLKTMPATPDPETVSTFARQLPTLPTHTPADTAAASTSTTTSTTNTSGEDDNVIIPYDFL
jgi:hypothetical protein